MKKLILASFLGLAAVASAGASTTSNQMANVVSAQELQAICTSPEGENSLLCKGYQAGEGVNTDLAIYPQGKDDETHCKHGAFHECYV